MQHTTRLAVVLTGLLALGCSGLFGYGDELGATSITSGSGFRLEFTASSEPDASHKLWLTYEVEYTSPYQVTGTLDLKRKGAGNTSYTVDLRKDGAPVVGGSRGRTSLNTREFNNNGKGTMSQTVYMTELPKLSPGEKVRIAGTLTAAKGTTLKSARLVVTD